MISTPLANLPFSNSFPGRSWTYVPSTAGPKIKCPYWAFLVSTRFAFCNSELLSPRRQAREGVEHPADFAKSANCAFNCPGLKLTLVWQQNWQTVEKRRGIVLSLFCRWEWKIRHLKWYGALLSQLQQTLPSRWYLSQPRTKDVYLFGSPPRYEMYFCVHLRAAIWSNKPAFATPPPFCNVFPARNPNAPSYELIRK